ncbi:hypothetical protein [Sphingobacterium haloxyli]|nr:hypothetical protein [Sphingobacterium haloxyli]
MKVLDVRSDRDSREFYENLIKESKRQIDIMGVTADRLIDHFADIDGDQERAKVLLRALNKKVKVRILLPEKEYIDSTKSSTFDSVKLKLEKLEKEYPLLEYRYFSYSPKHSIFRIDDTCILGPVFPERQSRDTPAIHFDSSSPFASKYLEHFEHEWENANA